MDASTGDLGIERESYDRLSFLLPYYKDHQEMRQVVDLKSPFEKFKLLSSIYAYNSSFLMIAGGNSEYFKKRSTDSKGYKALDGVWKDSLEIRKPAIYKLDSV